MTSEQFIFQDAEESFNALFFMFENKRKNLLKRVADAKAEGRFGDKFRAAIAAESDFLDKAGGHLQNIALGFQLLCPFEEPEPVNVPPPKYRERHENPERLRQQSIFRSHQLDNI